MFFNFFRIFKRKKKDELARFWDNHYAELGWIPVHIISVCNVSEINLDISKIQKEWCEINFGKDYDCLFNSLFLFKNKFDGELFSGTYFLYGNMRKNIINFKNSSNWQEKYQVRFCNNILEYRELVQEIEIWCVKNCKKKWFSKTDSIYLEDSNDAMMFKLTYGV